MLRGIIVLTLVAFVCSFTIFGHSFFENQQNEESLHLGDVIQKGTAITSDIQSKIKTFVEQAYIFNGNSTVKNIFFIQQQLGNLYGGNWVISIYGPYNSNSTDPNIGQNLGISSYSAQGQWWIYWKGVNHYQPSQAYYLSRQQGNQTNNTCVTNSNYTGYTEVFNNVVNAAEVDFKDIQNFTAQVQYYLHGYSTDLYPTVTAVNTTLPFFLCAWGTNTYNLIQKTAKLGLMVVATPRVG